MEYLARSNIRGRPGLNEDLLPHNRGFFMTERGYFDLVVKTWMDLPSIPLNRPAVRQSAFVKPPVVLR
jgi:hypothetical protein